MVFEKFPPFEFLVLRPRLPYSDVLRAYIRCRVIFHVYVILDEITWWEIFLSCSWDFWHEFFFLVSKFARINSFWSDRGVGQRPECDLQLFAINGDFFESNMCNSFLWLLLWSQPTTNMKGFLLVNKLIVFTLCYYWSQIPGMIYHQSIN